VNAQILTIGDELVLGQVVDTHSAYLAQRLATVGVRTFRHLCVADNVNAIAEAVQRSLGESDLLLILGGLGPTEDDLTRQAVAQALGAELILDPEWKVRIEERFHARGLDLPERNEIQAMIPRGARLLTNRLGTAAGFEATANGTRLVVLPGVPSEMKAMFEDHLLPGLSEAGDTIFVTRRLHCFGAPESSIHQQIEDLMKTGRHANPQVGILAQSGVITIKFVAEAANEIDARVKLDPLERTCRERLGELIFGRDGETLEVAVAKRLEARKKTLALAESCTGGLLGHLLTNIPGISRFFLGGIVAYSNAAKTELLGVPPEWFETVGAVSAKVAQAMAEGAGRKSGADVGVGITGIAGPEGGTREKPIGLVYIAVCVDGETTVERHQFRGMRETIKDRAAKSTFNLVRKCLA